MVSGEPGVEADFDLVTSGDADDFAVDLNKVHDYVERLGLISASSRMGQAFVNGKHFDLDDVGFIFIF